MKIEESDEQIMERLRERFEVLEDMTRAVKRGTVRSLIVSGAPGVGKSFGVEKVLGYHDMFATIANDQSLKQYEIVKGAIGELGMYQKLYEYRHKKNVVVFDDCDDVFQSERGLNMLKSALDTSKKRRLSWNFESHALKDAGIPNTFEFEGSVIFITNIDFNHVRSKVLRAHLEALEDRCHYFDLTVHSVRERCLRIKQVVSDGMLDSLNITDEAKEAVVDYVVANQNKLKLSLRTVSKTAELVQAFPDNDKWKRVAAMTLKKI
jgi:hypothetical protein